MANPGTPGGLGPFRGRAASCTPTSIVMKAGIVAQLSWFSAEKHLAKHIVRRVESFRT
jgi:hypothetical protein